MGALIQQMFEIIQHQQDFSLSQVAQNLFSDIRCSVKFEVERTAHDLKEFARFLQRGERNEIDAVFKYTDLPSSHFERQSCFTNTASACDRDETHIGSLEQVFKISQFLGTPNKGGGWIGQIV